MISVRELLRELIFISEKSSRISRICRAESDGLFRILIQEKTNIDSKNPRFQHDYKTFADVLIQEMAKFCLEIKFPGLSRQIYGEESNHFENKLGQHISVHIDPNDVTTYEMLVQILDGNVEVSKELIQVIYSPNTICGDLLNQINEFNLFVEQSEIAIWIDPIDSTSEYIKGQWQSTFSSLSLVPKGLHCVTCLFGVFDIKTGFPILGVLNQPFYKKTSESSYEGRCIWGFNINQVCQNNIEPSSISSESGIILFGGKESPELKEKLSHFAKVMYVAGAGHKLLNVALGQADLLFTSSKSTYYWDTCAAHAILRSLGGGIIPFENFIQLELDKVNDLDHLQIKYREKTPGMKNIECNNSKGLIAYRTLDMLKKTINLLKT